MCDRLVGRIDQVNSEVSSMLEKWRSVEEGGKSLEDASQKLLDERVRPRALTRIQHFLYATGSNMFFDRTNW
jgi:hypothetical protein